MSIDQKASVGRIVHFVFAEGDRLVHRPAIVVRAWASEGVYVAEDGVQLQVFVDGTNDARLLALGEDPRAGVVWRPSVHYSAEPKAGTWHWPERE